MVSLDSLHNNLSAFSNGVYVVYFSYSTPIAFVFQGKKYVSENVWSKTTGKHLNILEQDKSKRINNKIFNEMLDNVMKRGEVCVINDHVC